MRRASWFNIGSVALGLAFLYLPIVILVIYSFNGSRLVTVWGGWSTRWYAELLNDSCDGARDARDHRIGAVRTFPRTHAVFRHDLRTPGDARGDHRAFAAAA